MFEALFSMSFFTSTLFCRRVRAAESTRVSVISSCESTKVLNGLMNAILEGRKPQVKVENVMLGELKVERDDDVDEASNCEADRENTTWIF